MDAYDFGDCTEVVFCGYGEPTMVLENLIAVSAYVRERYPFKIRLNTNGLSDLIHKRSTAEEICRAVDSVSISLNMPDAASYCEVVRPAYGEKSFEGMLKFAQDCRKYLEDVRFTVVDVIGEENVKRAGNWLILWEYRCVSRILHLKPWDYSAGSLILQEAGGKVHQWSGEALPY